MRKYGYTIHGNTLRYCRSLNCGNRTSVITALSTDGLVSIELINRNTNGGFFDFVRGNLCFLNMYNCFCIYEQSVHARQSLESVDCGAWQWSCEYATFGDKNGVCEFDLKK